MKKQDVSKKVELDLDAALEEVAQKLRPSANMPACGQTNMYNTRFTANFDCSCCSENSAGQEYC